MCFRMAISQHKNYFYIFCAHVKAATAETLNRILKPWTKETGLPEYSLKLVVSGLRRCLEHINVNRVHKRIHEAAIFILRHFDVVI